MIRVISAVFPALVIALAVVLAALPWGVEPDWRFVLPGGVYAIVHHFTVADPARVPEWLVFGAGLSLDVLTGGPLGYWSLVYLAGYVVAVLQAPLGAQDRRGRVADRFGRWLKFVVALAVVAGLEWALASLYFLQPADVGPYVAAATVVVLAYPVLALVIDAVDVLPRRPPRVLSGFGSQTHGS
ncbi:MAG: hypothetical protein ACT4N2_04445 [Hyphomicrobium sp.]